MLNPQRQNSNRLRTVPGSVCPAGLLLHFAQSMTPGALTNRSDAAGLVPTDKEMLRWNAASPSETGEKPSDGVGPAGSRPHGRPGPPGDGTRREQRQTGPGEVREARVPRASRGRLGAGCADDVGGGLPDFVVWGVGFCGHDHDPAVGVLELVHGDRQPTGSGPAGTLNPRRARPVGCWSLAG